jgi:ABC-type uncharacterized transport system auxiliary subunit
MNAYSDSVSLKVDGGREKNPMGVPKISNESLLEAPTQSIEKSGLFSSVRDGDSDYRLELYVVKVSQPYVGTDMTVSVEIAWTLKNGKTNEIMWRKSLKTSDTATPSEKGAGISRLALATQRTARKNIEQGIKMLSQCHF